MAIEGGTRATVAALSGNLGLAVAKFVAFLATGASSLLAEAAHSVADAGHQALLLLGGRRVGREPATAAPFGAHRARYLHGFVVSVVLFVLAGVLAIVEGLQKVQEVRSGRENEMIVSRWWWLPLLVLLVAIGVEWLSLRTAAREGDRVRGALTWPQFARRATRPELPVVLVEDAAALVGLFLALGGVSMTLITRNGIWDAIATLAIGGVLIAVAAVLTIQMGSLLVGEAAAPDDLRAITTALVEPEDVERVIHMRTLHLGPEQLLVAAKIAVRPGADATAVAHAIDQAETGARRARPALALVIYLEPDLDVARRGPTGDGKQVQSGSSGVGG